MFHLAMILPYLVPAVLWFIAVGLWRLWVRSTKDKSCPLPLPPGCAGYPFVGEMLEIIWKKFDFYRERRAKYGRVYMTHMLGRPTVRVWGSENLRKVLRSEETHVTMNWPASVCALMGSGALIMSSRRLHAIRRRALAQAFTPKALDGYTPGVHKLVQKYLSNWCGQGLVDIKPASEVFSFEIIVRMLLGFDFSDELMMSMITNLKAIQGGFFSLPIDLPGFAFRKAMNGRKALLRDLDEILKHKTNNTETDCVSLLLNAKPGEHKLSLDAIKDEIIEMLFSGFQGMSSMLITCLVQLGQHPEVANKLLEELREHKVTEGDMTMEKLNELPYLEKVVSEALRFGAPFGGGFRKVLKTFELEGYQIPKGWSVLYSIRDNHESEENFSCARQFNPERWDKANTTGTHGNIHTNPTGTNPAADADNSLNAKGDLDLDAANSPSEGHGDGTVYRSVEEYRLMTFGGPGMRSCIGEKFVVLTLQLILCELVGGCHWKLSEIDPEMAYLPVMKPSGDLFVEFTSESKGLFPETINAGPLPSKVPL